MWIKTEDGNTYINLDKVKKIGIRSSITSDEFRLLVDGDVIATSLDKRKLEKMLEDIFDNNENF